MRRLIKNTVRFSWVFGFLFIPNMSFSDTKTFSFTGGVQTWVVPKGNKTITIEGYGAGGGYGENNGNNVGTPGKGGYLKSKITVTAGETLYIYVGKKGSDGKDYASHSTTTDNAYGGNNDSKGGYGGGSHSSYPNENGGGGGGSTDIRQGGTALSNRVFVVGAGGGAAGQYYNKGYINVQNYCSGDGGDGGGTTGETGGIGYHMSSTETCSHTGSKTVNSNNYRGKGGTGGSQSAGGTAGSGLSGNYCNFCSSGSPSNGDGTAGSSGSGGNGGSVFQAGGGGGGGYYGGGGGEGGAAGHGGGGGGGSSYSSGTILTNTQGHTNATGNGSITITYISRTGYTLRIVRKDVNKILEVLEAINTDSKNTTLTSKLDELSDKQLEKVAKMIKGDVIKRVSGSSVKTNKSFKRAVTNAISAPSISLNTRNNFASLTHKDLSVLNDTDHDSYNLYTFDEKTAFDVKAWANLLKNKNLFSLKSENSTLFVRSYVDILDQNKVGNDVGYGADTAGVIFGNLINIDDSTKQGWAAGLSTTETNFDENYGGNDTHTLHASFFQNQVFEKYALGLNIGSYISKGQLKRKVTEGIDQILTSDNIDIGFDAAFDFTKFIDFKNGLRFNPTISLNASLIIQDDIDETGGDLALKVNTEDLLMLKPEIGFNFDKSFIETQDTSQSLGLSIFTSLESKLSGRTSLATIKDTGSTYNIFDNNNDEQFLSLGLGYNYLHKPKDTELNISFYQSQNTTNSMNSSLLSFSFKKRF